MANETTQQLCQSRNIMLWRPLFQGRIVGSFRELSKVCSQIVSQMLVFGKHWKTLIFYGPWTNLLVLSLSARGACDKHSACLISHIHHTSEFKFHRHVGKHRTTMQIGTVSGLCVAPCWRTGALSAQWRSVGAVAARACCPFHWFSPCVHARFCWTFILTHATALKPSHSTKSYPLYHLQHQRIVRKGNSWLHLMMIHLTNWWGHVESIFCFEVMNHPRWKGGSAKTRRSGQSWMWWSVIIKDVTVWKSWSILYFVRDYFLGSYRERNQQTPNRNVRRDFCCKCWRQKCREICCEGWTRAPTLTLSHVCILDRERKWIDIEWGTFCQGFFLCV